MRRFLSLTLVAAAAAGATAPPPASSPDNAEAAAAIADEYAFIAAHPCPDGGVLIPYENFVDYYGDNILEIVLTRCPTCREERPFYFDLSPRYGTLPDFREDLLTTRPAAGPSDDNPCPTAANAVTVNSVTEEYVFLETTRHTCGTPYVSNGQALAGESGHYYDVLTASCPADGAQTDFYFNIDSFYGQFDKYPELVHMSHTGEAPGALAGRTPGTAYEAEDEAARADILAKATHAADGGKLALLKKWDYRDGVVHYGVAETTCPECGTPVRLYFTLTP